jgi:hypothetical protein
MTSHFDRVMSGFTIDKTAFNSSSDQGPIAGGLIFRSLDMRYIFNPVRAIAISGWERFCQRQNRVGGADCEG